MRVWAERMRRNPTEAEATALDRLVGMGIRVEAQVPVNRYILDLVDLDLPVVYELDRLGHLAPRQWAKDRKRDRWLQRHGVLVVRIQNAIALAEHSAFENTIMAAQDERSSWRRPSPSKTTCEQIGRILDERGRPLGCWVWTP